MADMIRLLVDGHEMVKDITPYWLRVNIRMHHGWMEHRIELGQVDYTGLTQELYATLERLLNGDSEFEYLLALLKRNIQKTSGLTIGDWIKAELEEYDHPASRLKRLSDYYKSYE